MNLIYIENVYLGKKLVLKHSIQQIQTFKFQI